MYSKYLSQTLQSKLEELSGLQDQLNLDEELKLMRVAALQAVLLFDAAHSAPDGTKGVDSARMAASLVMREALDAVGNLAERAARIGRMRQDVVGVQGLGVVVAQVVDKAYEVFGDEHVGLVREFAESIRAIRLPSDAAQGTLTTPDQDAAEMSDTIPKGP